jgi:hypothetical protein
VTLFCLAAKTSPLFESSGIAGARTSNRRAKEKRQSTLLLFTCLGCSVPQGNVKREPVPPHVATQVTLAKSAPLPFVDVAGVVPVPERKTVPNVGRFSVRVVVEPTDFSYCAGAIRGVDVLPSGTAWFVGGCGLRFRVDPEGHVNDFRAPLQTKSFNFGGVRGSCEVTGFFTGVFARSAREVYVVGDIRGGQDPNAIWYRPMELFNGEKWSSTKVAFGKGAHEGFPWSLAGNGELLYTLVEGDDWHGPPECAVHRFNKGSWGKAELVCSQPKAPNDRVMKLKSIDVARDGTLWVVGTVLMNDNPTSGMVWTRPPEHTEWTEIPIDDVELSSVSVSANGAVYAAGSSVWKFEAGKFARVSGSEEAFVDSLWAESSERVWFIRRGKPFLLTGGIEVAVALDSEEEPLTGIHGYGSTVWATSAYQVWQLQTDQVSRPLTKVVLSAPKL